MDDLRVKVYVNGDMERSAEVEFHPQMQFRDFLDTCKDKLRLRGHGKCRLFDSTGDEYSDDDMELLDPNEPLFLSQGEDFQKASSLALYEEVKSLGEGGFGTVKLFRHRITGTDVAIKFVEMKSMESFEDINRIFTEMNVLRGLHHPHIVTLLETFNLPDKLCIVMEYCRGGELKHVVDMEGPMNEDRAYSIAIQLCEAMRYCHNANVVHRDLKMENVLFADTMQMAIKVVDFGIAGAFRVGGHSETSEAGSLLYTAPEVINGADTRSLPSLDIWSMGCIFYYLVAGRHPFESETAQGTVSNILAARVPPLPAKLSKPWTHLINGILKLKPERRWDILRIEGHLQKHREDPQPCADCLFAAVEEEVKAEERKQPQGTRAPPAKSKSFRGPSTINASHFKGGQSPMKGARSPVKGPLSPVKPRTVRPEEKPKMGALRLTKPA